MTTLTVELSEALAQQLQNSGLSPEQVEPGSFGTQGVNQLVKRKT